MKFIITTFFEKHFKKKVLDMKLEDFVEKINVHSKGFIGLELPFYKIKLNTKNKTYRIIVSYEEGDCVIFFINIFDKKDKKVGNNLNWKMHGEDIRVWTRKNMECIRKGEYYNIEK